MEGGQYWLLCSSLIITLLHYFIPLLFVFLLFAVVDLKEEGEEDDKEVPPWPPIPVTLLNANEADDETKGISLLLVRRLSVDIAPGSPVLA